MGFRVDGVNGACHHAYDSPEVICFRDVADDAHASYWYEWQGISQDISVEQFFEEVEKCGLSREKLSARTFENGGGIVIDWGLRHQFWIPMSVINNGDWDLGYLRTSPADRIESQDVRLKPCPFCGGKAEIMVLQELRLGGDEGFVVWCESCHMNTASINGTYFSSSEDAMELWNRRV
jgi:Lar family restriction alleviation protein